MKKIVLIVVLLISGSLYGDEKLKAITKGSAEYNRWVSYTSTALLCNIPYSNMHTVFSQSFESTVDVYIMPKTNGNEIYMVGYGYKADTNMGFLLTFVSAYKNKKLISEFIVLQGFENGEKVFEKTNDEAANDVYKVYSRLIGE